MLPCVVLAPLKLNRRNNPVTRRSGMDNWETHKFHGTGTFPVTCLGYDRVRTSCSGIRTRPLFGDIQNSGVPPALKKTRATETASRQEFVGNCSL